MDRGPAGDQGGAIERLEFFKPRAIDDAGNHLADIEGLAQAARHDAEQILAVVNRRIGRARGAGPELAPVQVRHHLAAHADAIHLVLGQIIAQPRDRTVHLRPAQAFLVGVFAGGHLHQRRPAQKHLGLPPDEDVVVAHARLIGPAGGGGPEHHRDGGDAQLGQFGDLVEQATGLGEMADLAADGCFRILGARVPAQIGAGRLHELHIGHAVFARDLEAAHQFFRIEGIESASPHRRIVAENHALHPLDHADPDDKARAHIEVGAPGGQRADFQKRGVGIEHQRDPLAQGHLAAGAQARQRLFAAAARRLGM